MNNNSTLVWWIPIIILLLILFPFGEKIYNIYITFGLSAVGIFALWFVFSYLFFFKERKEAKLWGWVFLVVALFYNPVMTKLNIAILIANLSYPIAVLTNLVTAAVFIYNWWLFKFKEKKDK